MAGQQRGDRARLEPVRPQAHARAVRRRAKDELEVDKVELQGKEQAQEETKEEEDHRTASSSKAREKMLDDEGSGEVDAAEEEEGLSQAMGQDHGREDGEGRVPQLLRAPHRVSKEEREAHEVTHTPYRSWCPYCVRGRGRNTPHKTQGEQQRHGDIARVTLDYFFMSSVDEAASKNPILVAVDESTGEKYARAVGQKGLGREGELDWLIRDLSEELKAWGHAGGEAGHIIVKTDGERAIVAVRDALAKYHGGRVILEAPPRGESQSNGTVEEAGKTIREYTRVLKEQIEHKANLKLACTDVIVLWMIRWAAMLCSRYAVGKDGRTPYERRRGRRCKIPALMFGEKVWYKELRQSKDRKDKFESEWFLGIWLGHSRSSNEHLIGTKQGAIKAYAVKRQAEDERWDAALIQGLQGTPQQPDPHRPGIAIPVRVSFDPPAQGSGGPVLEEPEGERQIRRMRITAALLEKYGFSPNCEGCRFRQAGLGETRGHTEQCRSRIEKAMAQSEEGRRILEEQKERVNRRIAEQVERADAAQKSENLESTSKRTPSTTHEQQGALDGSPKLGASADGSEPKGDQDADMAGPVAESEDPEAFSGGGSPAGVADDQNLGEESRAEGRGRSGRADSPDGSSRERSRSRSPKRGPVDFNIGTPEKEASPGSTGQKRETPAEGPARKRPKQSESGTEMEIDAESTSLRKLIAVGAHTRIVGGAPAQEEVEELWSTAWDDVSGQELDPNGVRQARALEMDYVSKKGVWRKVPRSLASRNGWKVIPTRWIDINKGDADRPNYRSRLVAKEFNTGAQEGLFAATPPLEALRLLVSDAATTDVHEPKVIMLNDVARAFFEAPMKRTVCVELPQEALQEGEQDDDLVGLLQLSLYGTRDAAANFQAEVRKFMLNQGFAQSLYSPSVFWHRTRGLKVLVHGDDFVTSGVQREVHWFEERLNERFEVKTQIVGRATDRGEVSEARILGRILRAVEGGWEYEADPRHAELLIRNLRLEAANGVRSPGEDERPWAEEENSEPLRGTSATEYRALAARANYLAQDRADILFSAKEICRGMASPTMGHMKSLRRLVRYLIAHPRSVWMFPFQSPTSQLNMYSDSDWAGCKRTARSTSGGVAMIGAHCIRCYSVTQKFVTLSSGEAELMALVKATSEAIGIAQLAESWGMRVDANIFVDSSAALAVTNRKGCGKLRHVRIGHLWVQELAAEEQVRFNKVRGTANPADLLTKHLAAAQRNRLMPAIGLESRDGKARAGLALDRVETIRPDGRAPLGRGGVSDRTWDSHLR